MLSVTIVSVCVSRKGTRKIMDFCVTDVRFMCHRHEITRRSSISGPRVYPRSRQDKKTHPHLPSPLNHQVWSTPGKENDTRQWSYSDMFITVVKTCVHTLMTGYLLPNTPVTRSNTGLWILDTRTVCLITFPVGDTEKGNWTMILSNSSTGSGRSVCGGKL